MPSKNIIKTYVPHNYYHVYNRGVNKEPIFLENDDKQYLLNLIYNRSGFESSSVNVRENRSNKNLLGRSEILSFCLMNNHYHFLFWLDKNPAAIKTFMQNVFTAYSLYFNKKYNRIGPLFQSRYKASRIDSDPYLLHISRYIHLNPSNFEDHPYSSYQNYLGKNIHKFIKPDRILDLFKNSNYEKFVLDGLNESDDFNLF